MDIFYIHNPKYGFYLKLCIDPFDTLDIIKQRIIKQICEDWYITTNTINEHDVVLLCYNYDTVIETINDIMPNLKHHIILSPSFDSLINTHDILRPISYVARDTYEQIKIRIMLPGTPLTGVIPITLYVDLAKVRVQDIIDHTTYIISNHCSQSMYVRLVHLNHKPVDQNVILADLDHKPEYAASSIYPQWWNFTIYADLLGG